MKAKKRDFGIVCPVCVLPKACFCKNATFRPEDFKIKRDEHFIIKLAVKHLEKVFCSSKSFNHNLKNSKNPIVLWIVISYRIPSKYLQKKYKFNVLAIDLCCARDYEQELRFFIVMDKKPVLKIFHDSSTMFRSSDHNYIYFIKKRYKEQLANMILRAENKINTLKKKCVKKND